MRTGVSRSSLGALVAAVLLASSPAPAALLLGPEQVVQSSGVNLVVPGYSVPSWADWDGDGRKDLIVGQGGGTVLEGKVRIYLNAGTFSQPAFAGFTYAQAGGTDLSVPTSGCLGIFPRVVYWDADSRKDLLGGEAGGKVRLFTNIGTDAVPVFDSGVYLQVGQPGLKVDINVGYRATPTIADWNNDGRKDLVVGALDGKVRVYLNEGTEGAPDFRAVLFLQDSGTDLIVPTGRSSPCILDLDDDGRKDLLTGDTEGRVEFYHNSGTDQEPLFSGYVFVESSDVPIDLAGQPRSRPCVCHWGVDAYPDVLVGSGDGLVRLYEGEGISAVDLSPLPGAGLRLLAAYPNPTTGVQTYRIELPGTANVRAGIFDVNGTMVSRLLQTELPAGSHPLRWEAVDENGRPLPSGAYYLQVECEGARASLPLVLLRKNP